MDKSWDGNFKAIPLDHFEKMKSAARDLAERHRPPADPKVNDKHIYIRIGMSGTGIRPNYQVELPDGHVIAINGINHHEFGVEEFDNYRISQPYSIDQLNTMRIFGGTIES